MKEVTKEEVERAASTYCDFDGDLYVSMQTTLKEFVANRGKEEASESQMYTLWTAFNNTQGKNQRQRLCATTSSQS